MQTKRDRGTKGQEERGIKRERLWAYSVDFVLCDLIHSSFSFLRSHVSSKNRKTISISSFEKDKSKLVHKFMYLLETIETPVYI